MSARKSSLTILFILFITLFALAADTPKTFTVYFIHQSVGQNWLNSGMEDDVDETVTNAGHSFVMHESFSGNGDHREWPDRFNNDTDWQSYDIVMFKCCYPASNVESGAMLNQYKNTYTGPMTKIFQQNPNIFFVIVTAPPLVPNETNQANANRAREFNNWLKGEFIKGYQPAAAYKHNVAVFDFFDHLADGNNMLKAAYRADEWDSHPNNKGSREATPKFLPILCQGCDAWVGGTGGGGGGAALNAPKKLKAKAKNNGKILIKWKDKSNNEKGFEIQRRLGNNGEWHQIATTNANAKKYLDKGLKAGKVYHYRVRAYNNDGESPWSNIAKKKGK